MVIFYCFPPIIVAHFFGCHSENSLLLSQDTLSKGILLSLWPFFSSCPPKIDLRYPLFVSILSTSVSVHSVVSDSLQCHELQHTRPPCPSPAPGVYPNPCPLSCWSHPTTSSSVFPFSCPQSFPASGSFPMSQLFASGGQSIGVSASTSVLPMNTQGWSLGWTGWTSLQSKGLSRVFSNTTLQKHQFFGTQLSL